MISVEKQIKKTEKQIKKIKESKFKATKIETLKELDEIEREEIKEGLTFAIQAFLLAKKNGRGSIEGFARAVNLSRQTFSKYSKYYEENGFLPESKRKGIAPWNKTKDSNIMKIINATNKIIRRVDNFAKAEVPTLMRLLYQNVMKEVNHKYPEIKISLSTYRRIVEGSDLGISLKYETKFRRKLRKRLFILNKKLVDLKLLNKRTNIELKENSIKNKILTSNSKNKEFKVFEISKRRNESKPGMIIQWDGSLDQFKNKTKITRMQAIDHNTLSTMALSFVKNENNNGFQMLISQILDNYGIPSIILGDKRKGVDPTDEGALHSIVCKLLGISLCLDSNSIHKAELESLNGKMHPFMTYYSAMNQINTIPQLNKRSREIVKESNEYFNRKETNYSGMRKAAEEQKEILRGKIIQVYIKSSDGIICKKNVYQAYKNNKVIKLERFTWCIVSLESGIPKKIWTGKGIFSLVKVTKEFKYKVEADNDMFKMSEKHFIDNGVMILNRETYEILYKAILKLGEKKAIRYREWRLDEQIKEKIKRKKEL